VGSIFVARHAESEANVLRVISNRGKRHPLTARGRAQALALAERLVVYAPTAVYSSPLLRARETADVVASHARANVIELDGLREPDMGELEDRADAAAWQTHAGVRQRWAAGEWDARSPGGESLREVQIRLSGAIWQIVRQHPAEDDDVVAITHGSLIVDVLVPLCVPAEGFTIDFGLSYTTVVVVSARGGALTCGPLP
jgi:probable phosphoglycerate mutase